VKMLHFIGRRLQDYLELMVLEQPVRVLTEASVVGAARGLDVRDIPVGRAEHAKQRLRVRGARADLEVEWLLQKAAVRGPELRELEDEILESQRWSAADRQCSFQWASG